MKMARFIAFKYEKSRYIKAFYMFKAQFYKVATFFPGQIEKMKE